MSDANKAVFLSYASQDTEAARKICDALRAAGIEVWFDQSELRGGDAWDQKIRKQIKECALFVPVISANTQTRREGYFRIEWKLAAQRTHAIAEGTPFLLPLLRDGVMEADALVPAEFRDVQWTPLRDESAIGRFCQHVQQLIADPQSMPARAGGASSAARVAGVHPKKTGFIWAIGGIVAVLGIGAALLMTRPWERTGTPQPPATDAKKFTSRTAALAHRASIETRDELDVAVERAAREAKAIPDSAAAWATWARLEAQYIVRGWDVSESRRQDTQAHAKRAMVLDPNSTDAMFALAVVLLRQGAFVEAETLVRKAIAGDPSDAELRQELGTALSGLGRDADALKVRQENLRLFPDNPFAHYDLALSYERASPPDLEAALRKFDDSLALERFTSSVLHKASLVAGWKGDLAGAGQLLAGMDPVERTGDRAVGVTMMIHLLARNPERVIEAAGVTARNYFDDEYTRGPKAWWLAHAYAMAGKQNLALAQWREAETVLRQRVGAASPTWFDQAGLAITLAWLGANTEAAALMAPLESVARESPDPQRLLYVAYFHAGLGDAAKTAACLQSVLNRRELVTAKTLPLDPWWERVRSKPEFAVLDP